MKRSVFGLSLLLAMMAIAAEDNSRLKNTVLLDEVGVANLGVETEMVAEGVFENTAFAVGRIEEVPARHGVLSSRISGRIVEILAYEGDVVEAGQTLVRVESRQPGNPPPRIELKAPIGGLVTASHVRIGEPVQPDNELLDISDLSEVWAVARVPEHHAAGLKPGSKAWIRVTATGGERIEGELLRFGTAANRESGTIDAIFRVSNEGQRMRPGMRAEFNVILSQRDGVLSVPREAIQGDAANRYVFVKDFEIPYAFLKAPVQVGETNRGRSEILGGLFEGDEVVVRGAYSMGFVGGGGVSLKDALDAAHGHEHNEDGTEKIAGQKSGEGDGSDLHSEGHGGAVNLFLVFACGLLLVLLIVTLVIRKPQ